MVGIKAIMGIVNFLMSLDLYILLMDLNKCPRKNTLEAHRYFSHGFPCLSQVGKKRQLIFPNSFVLDSKGFPYSKNLSFINDEDDGFMGTLKQ